MQNQILDNLKAYKRKYYYNRILKGGLISLSLILGAFLIVNFLEFVGNFSSTGRALLFFSYIGLSLFVLFSFILNPIYQLLNLQKYLPDEVAAGQIGAYFGEIRDKLLNAIQLQKLSTSGGQLVEAALQQKTKELSPYAFDQAIDLRHNASYLKFLLPVLAAIGIIWYAFPAFFTETTPRLVYYNQTFAPAAPFQFVLKSETLEAFQDEPFDIKLSIEGTSIPENAFVQIGARRYKMEHDEAGFFITLPGMQQDFNFQFEAAGFYSQPYTFKIYQRPSLLNFNVKIQYPAYINKKAETLYNVGNLTIPQGSTLYWDFISAATDDVKVKFVPENQTFIATQSKEGVFSLSKRILQNTVYQINLLNKHASNREDINYTIEVIPDLYPKISTEEYADSNLFNFVVIGGNVQDDYGFTRMRLNYFITDAANRGNQTNMKSLNLSIDKNALVQNFAFKWNIDSLRIRPGQILNYYVEVWDNDGVNGPKSAKSQTYSLIVPSGDEIKKELSKTEKNAENQLSSSLNESKNIANELEKLKEKLKGKNQLNWQDKKALEDLVKKQDDLKNKIEELKKQNEMLNQKEEKLSPKSEEIAQKAEQLQKLLNELLDEETKKLYEELQKLLEEKAPKMDDIQKAIDKLEKKEQDLSKELDRALEMFKQLQFEKKMENLANELEKLAEKQEKEAEESQTINEKDSKALEEQKQDQKELNDMFKQAMDDLKALEELNKSLQDPNDMPDTGDEQEQISKEQQDASDQLNKNQGKKASKNQKNAAQQMKKMAQKMKESMEMNADAQAAENMEDLRFILENLIKLSYDQEALMKDFRKINQMDPKYLTLAQTQLKLKDDARIIEDSLRSLAKRAFQIQAFVTREVGQMNEHMEAAMDAAKIRRPDIAAGKGQLAMTSMNNLALMLSEVLKQMQEQMSQQQQKKGGQQCKKPGQGPPKPGQGSKPKNMSLSELQKQLNQRIESLKKGGQSGQQLSEELARMAQQQEAIRRALSEMEKSMQKGKDKSGGLGDLKEQMEKMEEDLVNKRINQQTIMRQQEILTRLLESEKAQKEREQEERREAETAKEINKSLPPNVEKYLKAKEKQIELLRNQSPDYTRFYKQETNRYLQSINP
jgi:hypothetical protein